MNSQVREPHRANSYDANRIAFRWRAAVDHTVLALSHAFQNPMRPTEIVCVGTANAKLQNPTSSMVLKKDAVRDFHDHDVPFSRRPAAGWTRRRRSCDGKTILCRSASARSECSRAFGRHATSRR
jgi:hypothetical protein